MSNTMVREKFIKGIRSEFSSPQFRSKNFDYMFKKIFNGACKMFESKQEIRFQFQPENPSKLGEIINKYKIVFKTIDNCIGAGPHTSVWINSKGLED